jgi:hypothetical protein
MFSSKNHNLWGGKYLYLWEYYYVCWNEFFFFKLNIIYLRVGIMCWSGQGGSRTLNPKPYFSNDLLGGSRTWSWLEWG